jgi:nucleotide-binding universal stress UspA family protein
VNKLTFIISASFIIGNLYRIKVMLMKKIIVPVDFSSTAANAAEFAGNLCIFYGAELWLYHTFQMPASASEVAFPLFNVTEMQKAAEQDLELMKTSLLKKLRSKIEVNTRVEMNILTEGLQELCGQLKPDLVVMGLSGKNALTQLIVGSNTIRITHELKYPVLVVPPKAAFSPVLRIGFACDYLQIEQNTPVALLKKVVKDFNAELHILNVDLENKNFIPEMIDESIGIKPLFNDINPVYESIEAETVTEGLNKYAKKAGLDWIVVIPKKHTVLQKIFNRSHSKDFIFHTHMPVLCMHV